MTPVERKQKIAGYGQAYELLAGTLKNFPRDMWPYKPGPARWSIQEILVHIADSEANSYISPRGSSRTGQTVMACDENRWYGSS
jgi:predicted component of type VI protein secretion system